MDVYILELLAYFLESLAMAHDDEPVIGFDVIFVNFDFSVYSMALTS